MHTEKIGVNLSYFAKATYLKSSFEIKNWYNDLFVWFELESYPGESRVNLSLKCLTWIDMKKIPYGISWVDIKIKMNFPGESLCNEISIDITCFVMTFMR